MDQILDQLGGLFLSSLPSVILLILLYFFLKFTLFNPLEKILAERYRKTEGREKDALAAMREAERKAEEYTNALHAAKAEIYSRQEALRKDLEAKRDAAIAAATVHSEALLAEGRAAVETEFKAAQATVEREAAALARLVDDKALFRGAA